jgi:hypothetical protein
MAAGLGVDDHAGAIASRRFVVIAAAPGRAFGPVLISGCSCAFWIDSWEDRPKFASVQ